MLSIVFVFVLFACSISSICFDQSIAFGLGRYTRKVVVLTNHPNTIFCSQGVPSPRSFRILVASARGRGSSFEVGRNTVCVARSAAFWARVIQSALSMATVMISSM